MGDILHDHEKHLEETTSALEGACDTAAFSSGMAAVSACPAADQSTHTSRHLHENLCLFVLSLAAQASRSSATIPPKQSPPEHPHKPDAPGALHI